MKARNWRGRFYVHILTFLYVYLELSTLVNGKILPSIQWSFRNPQFKEGGIRLNVFSYSKVSIICPNKHTHLVTSDLDLTESELYENIWMVDSLSYHSCNINTSIASNKKLLNCDKPNELNWIMLLFLPVSPSGPSYTPGETYYYISTTDGRKSSLDQRSKGHCETDDMKLEVYICKDLEDVHCAEAKSTQSTVSPVTNITKVPPSTTPQVPPSTTPQTPETSSQVNQSTTYSSPQEPANARASKRDKPLSTGVSLWIILIAVLGAILAVSMGMNFYFLKKNKSKSSSKNTNYDRENSLSPPLMAHPV